MSRDDRELRAAQEGRLAETWATPKGWRYFSAVNNTEVGMWYLLTAFGFMLFGGALALLVRLQLAVPDNDLLTADWYNQVFTLHGTVMMFLFAVPISEAVAILLLPAMLAARDLPFPRLTAFGYWCFAIGGLFVCGSIFFGAAPSGGWFMYPPLTTDTAQSGIGADIWLLGLSFIEIASIAAAIELIVGVLKCRPPGMRINLIPLYAWYVLVVGGMILFAFPPLIAGDILFELERLLDWPFFAAARGGDPLLWQHLFWIFGHPEVYIIFLPSIALLAMIVPTFAQHPIVGYSWIVLAAIATAFLSFGLWVHHMFTTGLPAISLGFFSAASMAVVIPTGIQFFVFLATLLAGRVVYSIPMLFATGTVAIFVLGGLTGVMVAMAPFDWQAHDTHFVVAHLHYTLIGGMFFPLIAGIYYYYPMVTGRRLSDRLGRWAFWLMFVGFNAAFLPMHVTGLRGMPRRVFTYPEGIGWDGLNLFTSVTAFIFAAGVLVVVFDALRPKSTKTKAECNPWNAGTLEWLTPQSEQAWGVRSVPIVTTRYPLWEQPDLAREANDGRFYLPDAEEGRRETMITSVLDADPLQVLRLPGNSFSPMIAALFTGGVFIFATFHWYLFAAISGLFALAAIVAWLWRGTAQPEKVEKPVGRGLKLPLYISGPQSAGWWAMFIAMVGDMAAFASFVFSYFFYWTIHDVFPPLGVTGPGQVWPSVAAVLLLSAWLATLAARRANTAGADTLCRLALLAGTGLAAAGSAALLYGPWVTGLNPTSHAYPAIVWTMVIWTVAHAVLGIVMQVYCLARSVAGHLNGRYDADIKNSTLFWHFTAVTVAVTVAVIAVFPLLT